MGKNISELLKTLCILTHSHHMVKGCTLAPSCPSILVSLHHFALPPVFPPGLSPSPFCLPALDLSCLYALAPLHPNTLQPLYQPAIAHSCLCVLFHLYPFSTLLPSHPCTLLPLYPPALVPSYHCASCPCTLLSSFSYPCAFLLCTLQSLHPPSLVPSHRCTISPCALSSSFPWAQPPFCLPILLPWWDCPVMKGVRTWGHKGMRLQGCEGMRAGGN